jgi:hypothetical protein
MLQGDSLYLTNAAGSKTYFYGASSTGAAQLRYDNSAKLTTTSTGIDVTGVVSATSISVGDSHTIGNDGFDNLEITSSTSENIVLKPAGSVFVYDSGSTTAGTIKIGGNAASLGLEMSYTQAGNTTATILANPTYTNDDALLKIAVDGDRNANQLVLDGTGNVGIGTTSPSTKLVVGGIDGVDGLSLEQQTNSSEYSARLFFGSGSATSALVGRSGGFGFFTGTTIGTASGTERLRIDSSGNVGIGTTSPTSKLHVFGGSSGTDVDVAAFKSNTGAFAIKCSNLAAANPTWTLRTFSGEPLAFAHGTSESARFDSSGNLLVGKTA